MQLGAEAIPPHTVPHGAKEVQGLLLQEEEMGSVSAGALLPEAVSGQCSLSFWGITT